MVEIKNNITLNCKNNCKNNKISLLKTFYTFELNKSHKN